MRYGEIWTLQSSPKTYLTQVLTKKLTTVCSLVSRRPTSRHRSSYSGQAEEKFEWRPIWSWKFHQCKRTFVLGGIGVQWFLVKWTVSVLYVLIVKNKTLSCEKSLNFLFNESFLLHNIPTQKLAIELERMLKVSVQWIIFFLKEPTIRNG